MANYRSIFLLISFSKIFEKIIYERLLQHININSILAEEQFGFRLATSTDKASYRLINEILNVMNERRVIGGIFCDLQKVSDFVNHTIFLTKLEFYGVTGTTLKLIKSYLEGRYQKVILDNNLPYSNSD
jgi:transposase